MHRGNLDLFFHFFNDNAKTINLWKFWKKSFYIVVRSKSCPENSGFSIIVIDFNSGVRNFHNYVCLEQDKSPSSQVIEVVSKALFSAYLCKSIYNLHYYFLLLKNIINYLCRYNIINGNIVTFRL